MDAAVRIRELERALARAEERADRAEKRADHAERQADCLYQQVRRMWRSPSDAGAESVARCSRLSTQADRRWGQGWRLGLRALVGPTLAQKIIAGRANLTELDVDTILDQMESRSAEIETAMPDLIVKEEGRKARQRKPTTAGHAPQHANFLGLLPDHVIRMILADEINVVGIRAECRSGTQIAAAVERVVAALVLHHQHKFDEIDALRCVGIDPSQKRLFDDLMTELQRRRNWDSFPMRVKWVCRKGIDKALGGGLVELVQEILDGWRGHGSRGPTRAAA